MREYKHKGKRKDNGLWVYGNVVQTKYGVYIVNDSNWYEVYPKTVGQYTGVHDDTDDQAELFDRDIVEVEYKGHKHICEVRYCGGGYMFVADSLSPDGYLWFADFIEFDRKYCWAEGTKKLGDIYTNPELLGGLEREKDWHI